MEKKCIGIDVGGTTVKIGIFETDGTLVYKWEVPSRKEENGAYILPDVAASIRKKLNERENYNKPKSENVRQPKCPPEKESAIIDALRYFGMI